MVEKTRTTINTRGEEGETPLHVVANQCGETGAVAVVGMLLEAGLGLGLGYETITIRYGGKGDAIARGG